jgi:NAD(P)H-quinone oxidoreductase subunit 5
MTESVIWIPLYGLLGTVATFPWALGIIKKSGPRPAAYINILITAISLLHSSLLLRYICASEPQQLDMMWLQAYDWQVSLSFWVSPLSVGAVVLVSGISLLTQIYALASLEMDWGMGRFYALLGFFSTAITAIALSDSLFFSYALLEMLTLSTYLLVGFWYAQPQVVTAARDAFWTKRLGDLILLMGVVALSTYAPSLNFSDLAIWASQPDTIAFFQANPLIANLLGLALIAGPTGKCAQFPLHLWLDEAMEGPNPASILRNSVVVAVGAYVLIRLQPVLALSPIALDTLILLGTITAVGASVVAIAQIDIKRALSHSTSAYLGLVFIAVGMGAPEVALALLFTHAIARALLFMSAGGIMLFTFTQDLTAMGGLAKKMPATALAFVVGSLSTIAVIPLGNFATMLNWLEAFGHAAPWLVPVLLTVNGVNAFGLVRIFGLVFLGQPKPRTRRVPEVPWPAAVPMVSLTIITLLLPVILFQWRILPHLDLSDPLPALLLVASGSVGILSGAWIYIKKYAEGSAVNMPPHLFMLIKKPIQDLFANDLNVRQIYKYTIVLFISFCSRTLAWIDRNLVDGLANFVGIASIFSGESLRYTITGRSQQYVFTILVGTLLVALISYWRTH